MPISSRPKRNESCKYSAYYAKQHKVQEHYGTPDEWRWHILESIPSGGELGQNSEFNNQNQCKLNGVEISW